MFTLSPVLPFDVEALRQSATQLIAALKSLMLFQLRHDAFRAGATLELDSYIRHLWVPLRHPFECPAGRESGLRSE